MARSSRSRLAPGLVAIVCVAAMTQISAHRRDEYLQAARIDIEPERVTIELDLTPGISVAARVWSEIDTDRDGSVGPAEARMYAERVLQDLSLSLDAEARKLSLDAAASRFPSMDAVMNGAGVIRLGFSATLPARTGAHRRLVFRNDHHADIGVYLANALMPETDLVKIGSQRRDFDQREIVIDYGAGTGSSANGLWFVGCVAVVLASFGFSLRRARR